MSWLKTDDRIGSHPKIIKAGPEAAWMWFVSTGWCKNHLTDGFIPTEVLPTLAAWSVPAAELAARCVAARRTPEGVGLFEAVPGGYRVHDYLDYNDSKADVLANMAKAASRKAEWRATRKRRRQRPARPTLVAPVPEVSQWDTRTTDHDQAAPCTHMCTDHDARDVHAGVSSGHGLTAGPCNAPSANASGVSQMDVVDGVPCASDSCPHETASPPGTDSDTYTDSVQDQDHRAVPARPTHAQTADADTPDHRQLCAIVRAERRAHPTLTGTDLIEHVKGVAARARLPYDSRHVWAAVDAVEAADRRRVG